MSIVRIKPDPTGRDAPTPEALIDELYKRLEQYEPQPFWSTASKSMVMRLRGIYAIGPQADEGIAEFGFRDFGPVPPIQSEAAAHIEALEKELQRYRVEFFTQQCEDRGF
jgi:hypothetical protein